MTTALEVGRGQSHIPAALYPRERPGTHCTGGWVGPRASQDRCGKSRPPAGNQSPDRPSRSESLYRLRYPGPYFLKIHFNNIFHIRLGLQNSLLTLQIHNFDTWSAIRSGRCIPVTQEVGRTTEVGGSLFDSP